MRTWRRPPAALAVGIGLLLVSMACTGDSESKPASASSPPPLPTSYTGEAPPGLAPEPIRALHGNEGTHEVLDDPMGVRITAVGDAFLISSDSAARHVLQRAADGEPVWEGSGRVERFTMDQDGEPAFTVIDTEGEQESTTAVSHSGTELWHGSDPRDNYVDGWVVRYPEGWNAEEPYGEYTVLDVTGEEIWNWEFEEPEEPAGDEESEDDADGDADQPSRRGAPLGASGDVLLLSDGAGLLQARDLADGGEPLWSVTADDTEITGEDTLPRHDPQLVDVYPAPGEESAEEEGDDEGSESGLLVRWCHPEEPSLLSLLDLETGEPIWALREPGTNPIDQEFATAPVPGTVYSAGTGTVLLPQGSGVASVIAVDLAEGAIRWELEDDDEDESSISPALAVDSYVYGDSRGVDDFAQVVLEAETKDVVADELSGYVEAVTRDGYALVVQDRQRFVFPAVEDPEATPEPGESPTPEED